jgi:O-antigen ligase
MDLLFAIGQAIALGALLYGAILCFAWRDAYGTEKRPSSQPARAYTPETTVSHAQYVAAAETDPAS